MSIISEALKKVEKEKIAEKPAVVHIRLEEEKKKAVNLFAARLIILWSCAFALIFIFIMILLPPRKGTMAKNTIARVSRLNNSNIGFFTIKGEDAKSGSAGQLDKALAPFVNHSAFELSGIMLSDEEPVAIINNKIVKRGDTVNGATVDAIEENLVKLSCQGQELTLEVK